MTMLESRGSLRTRIHLSISQVAIKSIVHLESQTLVNDKTLNDLDKEHCTKDKQSIVLLNGDCSCTTRALSWSDSAKTHNQS